MLAFCQQRLDLLCLHCYALPTASAYCHSSHLSSFILPLHSRTIIIALRCLFLRSRSVCFLGFSTHIYMRSNAPSEVLERTPL
ncbi:hypothetical protein BD311DRAFT_761290 [Dichomitus squalens]|uniref:Uncharacterized protein n=1 Tax=Dichomitus squalens TaxID=114155 RepID=A0A4Q9MHW1_9APHY|nr:hypothetical protein BD311DRAFT_761290 [Dichomitus squalens]